MSSGHFNQKDSGARKFVFTSSCDTTEIALFDEFPVEGSVLIQVSSITQFCCCCCHGLLKKATTGGLLPYA